MAEADAEDLLLHGVQLPKEPQKVKDPGIVAVGIAAAPREHEPVVEPDLRLVPGELPADGAEHVPLLPGPRQHFLEDPEVAPVLGTHVLGVLRAQQHREPPDAHHRPFGIPPRIHSASPSPERYRAAKI